MMNNENTSFSRWKGQEGFTLLEMVVSITLFLMVTGIIWGALAVSRQSKVMVNQEVELSKTMRVGLNLIGRDTYNAGFGYPVTSAVQLPNNRLIELLDITDDGDSTRDLAPPIIAANNLHPNNLNEEPTTRTDQVTFLYKDTSFNPVGDEEEKKVSMSVSIHPVDTNDEGIDEIVPISGSNAVANKNDLYLIRGSTSSTLVVATDTVDGDKIQFADTDILNFNQPGEDGPLYDVPIPASLHRVNMVTYFVTAEGVLTRRRYANIPEQTPQPEFIDDPLVYGVENFQIQYVLDTGALVDAPTAGQLDNIRQIRYTISVKSWETDAQGNPYRTSMTSTYSTRNLGY